MSDLPGRTTERQKADYRPTGGHAMRFRSKPSEIEAIQYGPEFRPGLVDEVASFIAGRSVMDSDVIEFVQPLAPWDPPDPEYSTIRIMAGADGAQGWVPVPLGHWIVRQPGDLTDHWPVDPDYFAAKYVSAEQPLTKDTYQPAGASDE